MHRNHDLRLRNKGERNHPKRRTGSKQTKQKEKHPNSQWRDKQSIRKINIENDNKSEESIWRTLQENCILVSAKNPLDQGKNRC